MSPERIVYARAVLAAQAYPAFGPIELQEVWPAHSPICTCGLPSAYMLIAAPKPAPGLLAQTPTPTITTTSLITCPHAHHLTQGCPHQHCSGHIYHTQPCHADPTALLNHSTKLCEPCQARPHLHAAAQHALHKGEPGVDLGQGLRQHPRSVSQHPPQAPIVDPEAHQAADCGARALL